MTTDFFEARNISVDNIRFVGKSPKRKSDIFSNSGSISLLIIYNTHRGTLLKNIEGTPKTDIIK